MEKLLWKSKLSKIPSNNISISDCSISNWDLYFREKEDIILPGTKNTFRIYKSGGETGPVFVFLHGAGYSALSWSLVVSEMNLSEGCRMMAYDCRGHGDTITENDNDLSVETLTTDVVDLVNFVYSDQSVRIVLVGHSMGGAIAARAAYSSKIINLVGVVVIDVVEGTAMAALSHMHTILQNRPDHFQSLEEAIEWSISSGTLRNLESAKVSIPTQLIKKEEKYYWRTDLFKSEQYWEGWFTGLSKIFLSTKVVKLLILAGTDRLDKDLTIGQMQGKFQLVLLPSCGHAIQEDDPKKTAEALILFKQRYKF
jgi:pimeloyl-ACP methyl ester carboxylesterase